MTSAWLRPNGFFMSLLNSSEYATLCADDPLYKKRERA
jgi:hypothetical protein